MIQTVRLGLWQGLFLFALTTTAPAHATVYYVSDCQAGAAQGCVAGDDANPGTDIDHPWKTTTKVNAVMESLSAADEIRFAKGASLSPARLTIFNLQSRAHRPLVFDSYRPRWGNGLQKPILTGEGDAGVLSFADSGDADHDEGYVVRNLDIRGQGKATGVFIYNDADYITLENLDISNFEIGIDCSDSNAPAPGSDGHNDFIVVRNSFIRHNKGLGYLGGCRNVLVENNRFDNNGFGGDLLNRNHNVYITGKALNVVVRGNVLTRSAVGAGQCQGVPIVVHDNQVGLVIENNFIDEGAGAGAGCYGIQVNPGYPNTPESLAGTIIRGNTIVNVGGVGISVGSCPGCVIEDNVIVQERPGDFTGITMPAENIEVGVDAADDRLTVRNNHIFVAKAGRVSVGIRVETYGSRHRVTGNRMLFGPKSAQAQCFSTTKLGRASFAEFDGNVCASSAKLIYSSTYKTLAQAQAAGFDVHGAAPADLGIELPSASNGYKLKQPDRAKQVAR
jgi:hypothetical protein